MKDHPESAMCRLSVAPGLRETGGRLRDLGFDTAGLRRLLGVAGSEIPAAATDLVRYERRLAAVASPLAAVCAVLVLAQDRPADELVAGLGRHAVDALVAGGALAEDGGSLHAEVRLLPHGDLLVASDRRPGPGRLAGPAHVPGINPPATLLASLTVRAEGGATLDLGTGNGIQALLAAAHSDRVVATDVNPRALEFAAFNAALNGVQGIEFRQGSWFEPVGSERFDLVVSNPPYVISPDNDLTYRDSGDEPGALCGRLVHDVTGHLEDGGFATMLVSWPLDGDAPWWTVPASWLGPDALAWLLMMHREDPATHAAQWNLPLAGPGDAAGLDPYRAALSRWESYLEQRGIDAIGYGAVVQQRRPGAGRVLRADEIRSGSGSASDHLRRVFRAADLLGTSPDLAVADRTGSVPAQARLEATMAAVDGGWAQQAAALTLAEGFGIRAELDAVMTEVVLEVTGGATVDAAADVVATRAGLGSEDACRLQMASRDMVAELVGLGLLELAGTDPDATPPTAEPVLSYRPDVAPVK